jgi:uncharacterized membrane protein
VFAAAINAHGQVVGEYRFADGRGDHLWAYTWSRARGFTVLMENAAATDINDHGQIVGYRYLCDPPLPKEGHPCAGQHGFLWDPETGFVDLGTFRPVAIGNDGRMAGECQNRGGCIRTPSGLRILPSGFFPTDINDRAVVAGVWFRRSGSGPERRRPAVWMLSTGVRELDPAGPDGTTWAINNGGVVAGARDGDTVRGEPVRATLWTPFGASLASQANAAAVGLSERGWAVGTVLPAGARVVAPALWRLGKGLTRLPVTGDVFGRAMAVNDAGQIVGEVGTPHGRTRAVLWIVK